MAREMLSCPQSLGEHESRRGQTEGACRSGTSRDFNGGRRAITPSGGKELDSIFAQILAFDPILSGMPNADKQLIFLRCRRTTMQNAEYRPRLPSKN
jgi:hypothetical protein